MEGDEHQKKLSYPQPQQIITDQDLHNRYHRLIYKVAWTMKRILHHSDHITSYHNEMGDTETAFQDVFCDPRQALEDPPLTS